MPKEEQCSVLNNFHELYADTKEASEILGYSTRWLRNRKKNGLPPHSNVAIGQSYFYKREELIGLEKKK